jgi:hypothetical protein
VKREYEMTQADMDKILEACRPTVCIQVGGLGPSSPQDNANAAWRALGERMGFDGMTVEPSARGPLFFLATPKETKEQKLAAQRKLLSARANELESALARVRDDLYALELETPNDQA